MIATKQNMSKENNCFYDINIEVVLNDRHKTEYEQREHIPIHELFRIICGVQFL